MKLNISGPQNSTVMENLSFKREEPNTEKLRTSSDAPIATVENG